MKGQGWSVEGIQRYNELIKSVLNDSTRWSKKFDRAMREFCAQRLKKELVNQEEKYPSSYLTEDKGILCLSANDMGQQDLSPIPKNKQQFIIEDLHKWMKEEDFCLFPHEMKNDQI